jgi:uncharacterized repeat protein (TIGR01451 family)
MFMRSAKNVMTRLFSSLKSGVVTGVIIGMAIVLPVATSAQDTIQLEGSLGVANVTAGDSAYGQSVTATYNQVVKAQVYYSNKADPASNKVANNVRVKIAMPTQGGKAQSISSSVKADNSNEVKSQATVNIDHDDATLQYIPGSAVWKHNTGSREKPTVEETKISDEVVFGAQGLVLENEKPGAEYGATVSVQARVMVPGVKIIKESQLKTDSNKWSNNNSAKPGDTMRYLISYQNTSNTDHKQVTVRDIMPATLQLVPGTTTIYNSSNPSGVKATSDAITVGGIIIGDYGPGSNAYVAFEATIAGADKLACGNNEIRNIGAVRPKDMNDYYNSAVTTVKRNCAAASTTPQAAATCDQLTVTKGDNRKVTVKVDYTATNGAKLKNVTYDFGDGSQPLTTDKTTVEYTYKKDGDFTITAKLLVTINGKDQPVTSAACSKPVSFAAPAAPAAPTPTPKPSSAAPLPSTGPENIVGLFVVATAIGFFGYRWHLVRKLAR